MVAAIFIGLIALAIFFGGLGAEIQHRNMLADPARRRVYSLDRAWTYIEGAGGAAADEQWREYLQRQRRRDS